MDLFEIILFKGDDKFIIWLRECRETGVQVSLSQVKTKVGEILASCGQQDVEKTCKWFLLWHNRCVKLSHFTYKTMLKHWGETWKCLSV